MPINVRDATSLWDMVEAIKKIQEFTVGMTEEDYSENELLQSAVERKLGILGEAARRISVEFQAEHSEIDWRNMIGLRNVIAHQYDKLRQDMIWRIVQNILPNLLDLLEPLLPPIEE